ncbi:MAG TPA: hypothetical protein VGS41_19220, partial [Chthonomonadales bacterium]|nr:hypothetical protein [Chthonomonadales bacterium]
MAQAISGQQQAGYGYVTSSVQVYALRWSGTAASAADLHPADPNAYASYAVAIDPVNRQQGGYVDYAGEDHAYL